MQTVKCHSLNTNTGTTKYHYPFCILTDDQINQYNRPCYIRPLFGVFLKTNVTFPWDTRLPIIDFFHAICCEGSVLFPSVLMAWQICLSLAGSSSVYWLDKLSVVEIPSVLCIALFGCALSLSFKWARKSWHSRTAWSPAVLPRNNLKITTGSTNPLGFFSQCHTVAERI